MTNTVLGYGIKFSWVDLYLFAVENGIIKDNYVKKMIDDELIIIDYIIENSKDHIIELYNKSDYISDYIKKYLQTDKKNIIIY
jgi:hypothetical protein